MKKYHFLILVILTTVSCKAQNIDSLGYIPKGYVVLEKIYGDLNNDDLEDCVLIIKGTDKKNIVINRFNKEVDRNRRGIIILFKKNNNYELATKNDNCFSSENEDGGVYYPPQLLIEIEKGNLFIKYHHGRYGYWQYTFRYIDSDFKLITYDATTGGAVISSEVSIDFLTKKKIVRKNINEDSEGNDEIFKETIKNISINKYIKLSEIKSFEELHININKY